MEGFTWLLLQPCERNTQVIAPDSAGLPFRLVHNGLLLHSRVQREQGLYRLELPDRELWVDGELSESREAWPEHWPYLMMRSVME